MAVTRLKRKNARNKIRAKKRVADLELALNKLRENFQKKTYGGLHLGNMFKTCDPDNSSFVTVSNFQQCLKQNTDLRLTRHDILALTEKFDPEHKGKISCLEF